MIGKLIIIGIIVATIVILAPSASKLFQNAPSLDAVKDKIDQATSNKDTNYTSKLIVNAANIEKKLGTNSSTGSSMINGVSVPSDVNNNTLTTVYQLPTRYVDQHNYTGQVFEKTGNSCQISVPELAETINGKRDLTHIIQLSPCSANVGEPVQVISLTAKSDSPLVNPSTGLKISPYSKGDNSNPSSPSSSNPSSPSSSNPSSPSSSNPPVLPAYYNVIQLTAENQGNDVVINFIDSSSQTKSVIITMRNNENVLFTGSFYSSKFTTTVKDIPNTSHMIEMTIDNAIYGTLHASAYAPSNMQNSIITGILSK